MVTTMRTTMRMRTRMATTSRMRTKMMKITVMTMRMKITVMTMRMTTKTIMMMKAQMIGYWAEGSSDGPKAHTSALCRS